MSRFVLLGPKLTPPPPPCQFQQFPSRGKFFSFCKFLGRFDEKRAAATPLIDQSCQNLVRACLKDKN